ncbi:MAG: ABC transporter [Methanoculleus sp. SDB]|nr:MAG: ABC transporter [Methanoculleus sp. SDB]
MLRIENVSKDLGEFRLKNVSLDVKNGEYMVIIGPTGAGKTILLETVAGVYPPDSGNVLLLGNDITHQPPKDRNITMVYQDYMLFPHLTVGENIAFGLNNRKVPKDEKEKRVSDVAELFGIDHLLHRYPETLSGGEQQRAAISRAIILNPAVLLLDEPLSALDGQTREKLRKELKRLHTIFGTTIIHITHNFEEVFSLADRVAVMNKGEIVQIGEPDDIFRRPESEFIAQFVGVENLFRGVCRKEGGEAYIDVNGQRIVSSTCMNGESVYASIRPEDIFVSRETLDASARNSFQGTIVEIVDNGMFIRLTVDAGIPFVVVVTRQGYEAMSLTMGESVYLTFKAGSVHVF